MSAEETTNCQRTGDVGDQTPDSSTLQRCKWYFSSMRDIVDVI
jgi:hypothetical protein